MIRAPGRGASLFMLSSACSWQEPEVYEPAPPDMSALTAAYDHPTGTLDNSSLAVVVDAARRTLERIATLSIETALLDLVSDAAGAVSRVGALDSGHLQARRVCPGWEATPAVAEGQGRIELWLGFDQQRIAELAWGRVSACQYVAAGRRILLYGPSGTVSADVRLSFGEDVAFDAVAAHPLLVDLDATAEVDGSVVPADFDFRRDPAASRLELRVPVADGDVVAVIDSGELAGVRAENGFFTTLP